MSLSPTSRGGTPGSSSSSQGVSIDQATTSSSTSMTINMDGTPGLSGQDDAERFRKRMELEQTMHTLQQRLKLASMKAENGWTGMSMDEIETQLPAMSKKRGKPPMTIATSPISPLSSTSPSTSSIPYEPPSPSRPWQLIDVLWQPLPPPSASRNGYPSPSSPLKRSRTDDHDRVPSPRGFGDGHHHHKHSPGHIRRASGSFHPNSPIGQVRQDGKKRSQSHSHHHRLSPPLPPPPPPGRPSNQDVDAAKALTEMLGSGSPRPGSHSPSEVNGNTTHLSSALPLPPSFENDPIPRRSSVTPKPPDEEDKNAAELMMFLAHSPSPAAPKPRIGPNSPKRSMGTAARVLFADGGGGGGGGGETGKVDKHSNLVSAPPITATRGDEQHFGGLLGADT